MRYCSRVDRLTGMSNACALKKVKKLFKWRQTVTDPVYNKHNRANIASPQDPAGKQSARPAQWLCAPAMPGIEREIR
jgi:hypothetical protein